MSVNLDSIPRAIENLLPPCTGFFSTALSRQFSSGCTEGFGKKSPKSLEIFPQCARAQFPNSAFQATFRPLPKYSVNCFEARVSIMFITGRRAFPSLSTRTTVEHWEQNEMPLISSLGIPVRCSNSLVLLQVASHQSSGACSALYKFLKLCLYDWTD